MTHKSHQATHDELQLVSRELVQGRARIAELEWALTRIDKWVGEFPPTGKYWDGSDVEMSYSACYGSNGERDFMRDVARQALGTVKGDGK